MAQIRTGSASVTIHQNRIIASADADWSAVSPGFSYFMFEGDTEPYFLIQTKTLPGASVSGNWEITLAANYDVASRANAAYLIHLWFTNRLALALFDYGDLIAKQLLNRNALLIDNAGGTGGGGGSGGGAGNLLIVGSITAITTADKTKPFYAGEDAAGGLTIWRLEVGAPTSVDKATADDPASRWRRIS